MKTKRKSTGLQNKTRNRLYQQGTARIVAFFLSMADKKGILFNIYTLVARCRWFKMPDPVAVELIQEVLTLLAQIRVTVNLHSFRLKKCRSDLIQYFQTLKTHSSTPNSNKATSLCPLLCSPSPHFAAPVPNVEIEHVFADGFKSSP